MLTEMLDKLLENVHLANRPTQIVLEGRLYVFQPATNRYEEVVPYSSPNKEHSFGTIESLANYLQINVEDKDACTILVGPAGVVAHLNENEKHRQDIVRIPFFCGDLPPSRPMKYEELLEYLDTHVGHVDDEEELRRVLSFLRLRKGEDLIVQEAGATIRMEHKSTRAIDAGRTEFQPVNVPKHITIKLRIGTREHVLPHRFRLRVSADDGQPTFRLMKIDRDDSLDHWMDACIEELHERLDEGWGIYRGAR